MTEPPTPSELDRRLTELAQDQRNGFSALNQRLDGFPTEKTIVALFAARDNQINALQQQVTGFASELDQERRDREAADDKERRDRENGDKAIQLEATGARRWAINTLIGGLVGAAAILGFFIRVMGGTA